MSESSVLAHLGIIEQRTNELLQVCGGLFPFGMLQEGGCPGCLSSAGNIWGVKGELLRTGVVWGLCFQGGVCITNCVLPVTCVCFSAIEAVVTNMR